MLNAIEVFLACLKKLNEQNKEEGAKTKGRKRNNQKKKNVKKHYNIKQPEGQAKNDVAQTLIEISKPKATTKRYSCRSY